MQVGTAKAKFGLVGAGAEPRLPHVHVAAFVVEFLARFADLAAVDPELVGAACRSLQPSGVVARPRHFEIAVGCVIDRGVPGGEEMGRLAVARFGAPGEGDYFAAGRHRRGFVFAAQGQVLEGRLSLALGPLPDFVGLTTPDPPVGRRGAAAHRRAAQDEGAEFEQAAEVEFIGVDRVALFDLTAAAQGHRAFAQLRGPFAVEVAEEVAGAVGVVLGHQRRSLAGELLAYLLQLVQLLVRGKADAAVGEHAGPQHAAGDHRDQDAADEAVGAQGDDRPGDRQGQRHRGGGGERLAAGPGRADDDDRRAGEEAGRVERQGGVATPLRPGDPEARERRDERQRDQHHGDDGPVRIEAKVPGGPDAEHLQDVQWAAQVAFGVGVGEWRGGGRHQAGADHRQDEQRKRQDEGKGLEGGRAGPEAAPREHRQHGQHRRQPDQAAEAEHADQGGGGQGKQGGVTARGSGAHRGRRQRHGQGYAGRRPHLLHPAPERVAEEQGRLSGDEGGEGAQAGAAQHPAEDLPEAQREHRGEKADVGLEDPGQISADQLLGRAEGNEDADRVTAGEVEVERRAVGGGFEAGEAATVLHHPVGHREPGGRVVELDEAGEGRMAGEQDRRSEEEEDGKGDGRRPERGTAEAPGQGEAGAEDREDDQDRHGQLGRRVAPGGELADEDHSRQAGRRHQCTGQAAAAEDVDQEAEADAERQQDEGEDRPGRKEAHARRAEAGVSRPGAPWPRGRGSSPAGRPGHRPRPARCRRSWRSRRWSAFRRWSRLRDRRPSCA